MVGTKRGQKSLDGFISSSQSAKKARVENDNVDSASNGGATKLQPSSNTEAYIKELPGKIATFDAAAAVDAHPPLGQLMDWMSEVREVGPGEAVVYWMRNEDLRSTSSPPFRLQCNFSLNKGPSPSRGQPCTRIRFKACYQGIHTSNRPFCDQPRRL